MFSQLLAEYVEWTPAALHGELERLELESRALHAKRLAVRAAAELKQTPAIDGHKSTQAYLRATCNQPAGVALAEVRRARLCRDFPQVGEALLAGRIGVGQLDEFVRITRNERAVKHLDVGQVDMLLVHAEHLTIREFGQAVDRWLSWTDPDGAWREHNEAIDHRTGHVVIANGEVSIAALGGDVLTAEGLRNILDHFVELEFRKDCAARKQQYGERADQYPLPRTDAQRLFDAIVAIFHRAYAASADGKLPDPIINIVCDQRTLQDFMARAGIVLAGGDTLDLDDSSRRQIEAVLAEFVTDPTSILTRRCETSSGHAVPPRLLIQALLTAQIRRVVLDARSTVIDLGERTRLFTGNARIAATLLERFCHHPGCEVAADRSQIDHNESHADGGRTDQDNAGPECGPHNRFKYRNGWRTRRSDNGRIYNIRSDGTVVLFIGERPPEFVQADDHDRIRTRVAQLQSLRQPHQHQAA